MQSIEALSHPCPKCRAQRGEACVTLAGAVAEKVHYGRPSRTDKRLQMATARAKETLRTSPLRPTAASTGIWIGSEFVSRDESVPYGAWYCPCGERREAVSFQGVMEMNRLYAEHQPCRS